MTTLNADAAATSEGCEVSQEQQNEWSSTVDWLGNMPGDYWVRLSRRTVVAVDREMKRLRTELETERAMRTELEIARLELTPFIVPLVTVRFDDQSDEQCDSLCGMPVSMF